MDLRYEVTKLIDAYMEYLIASREFEKETGISVCNGLEQIQVSGGIKKIAEEFGVDLAISLNPNKETIHFKTEINSMGFSEVREID